MMTKEEELTQAGWTKQTTYDEPRLSEMTEMYEELGLEVRLEPFDPGDSPGCSECMMTEPGRFKTIYTRRKEEE